MFLPWSVFCLLPSLLLGKHQCEHQSRSTAATESHLPLGESHVGCPHKPGLAPGRQALTGVGADCRIGNSEIYDVWTR